MYIYMQMRHLKSDITHTNICKEDMLKIVIRDLLKMMGQSNAGKHTGNCHIYFRRPVGV